MDLRLKFNEDPLNYDKYRPTYSEELFKDIIDYGELNNSKIALEIGIGTGQATLPILEAGCSVTTIELGEDLARYVKEKFSSFKNFEVQNIDFEDFISDKNQYDFVYSATAFHWIPEDVGFKKVYDLLKPGGTIALFWNHPFVNRDDDKIHREIRKVYRKFKPSDKEPTEFNEDACKKYTQILEEYGFTNIKSKIYRKTRKLKASEYISLLETYSDHRQCDEGLKNNLCNGITEAINKFGGEINIYDTMDLYLGKKPLSDYEIKKHKLVCFDLDDTLIREIHSVMLPCILNGKEKEHSSIQEKEETGKIDYIEADYLRAKLLFGLEESKIKHSFLEVVKPLKNIRNVIELLHSQGIKCIVITVGPKQVAKVACDIWGFDGYYGSEYEVRDGIFTGEIINYIKSENKVEYLKDFCKRNNINPEECIAVGDGSTDIPIFNFCSKSIAINASERVKEHASYAVDTDDLMDIFKYIGSEYE